MTFHSKAKKLIWPTPDVKTKNLELFLLALENFYKHFWATYHQETLTGGKVLIIEIKTIKRGTSIAVLRFIWNFFFRFFFNLFFLPAIWLLQGQLWAIGKWKGSLTRCSSLHCHYFVLLVRGSTVGILGSKAAQPRAWWDLNGQPFDSSVKRSECNPPSNYSEVANINFWLVFIFV